MTTKVFHVASWSKRTVTPPIELAVCPPVHRRSHAWTASRCTPSAGVAPARSANASRLVSVSVALGTWARISETPLASPSRTPVNFVPRRVPRQVHWSNPLGTLSCWGSGQESPRPRQASMVEATEAGVAVPQAASRAHTKPRVAIDRNGRTDARRPIGRRCDLVGMIRKGFRNVLSNLEPTSSACGKERVPEPAGGHSPRSSHRGASRPFRSAGLERMIGQCERDTHVEPTSNPVTRIRPRPGCDIAGATLA